MPHTLEEAFQTQRTEFERRLGRRAAVGRQRLGTRISQLRRLRSPAREILLQRQERAEQEALAGGLAQIAASEFTARQRQEEIQLQRESLALERRRFDEQLVARRAGRRRRRRGGFARLAGAGLGLIPGFPGGPAGGAIIGGGLAEAFGGL